MRQKSFSALKRAVTIIILFPYISGAFSQVTEGWEGKVMTVRGLIPSDSMKVTLPHEHLLIVHKFNYLDLTNEADAISELGYYMNAGGKTLAEASAIGIGRNPEGLKRISEATGANVIMSAGYYKDAWIHDSIKNKSVGQLSATIINDIKNGIGGIHAGFIKIAMSNPITPFEEKVLVAAARAQIATGVAIDVHFDGQRAPAADRHHVLDVFENEGVDLTRVYLSHCVPHLDLVDDFIKMAKRGCFLSFDIIGLEIRVDFEGELQIPETLNALIDAGYLNQILISQDVCFSICYVKNGGNGYAHLLNNIVPQLKNSGITDAQVHTMMVDNPKRLFPFKNYSDPGKCVSATYTAATGTVSDNSGTSDYHNNMTCSKLLQPSNCSSVTLTFTAFNTEPGKDIVRVYDGATTSSRLLGEYSGNSLPPALSSTGSSMLVVFTTDNHNVASGWSANYKGKTTSTINCEDEFYTALTGTITDNSGNADYNNTMSCQKLIQPSGAVNITLTFDSFATESGYDFVKVYDGSTTSAPLLGQFSGTSLPPAVTSTGGSMLIVFTTDNGVVAAGWSATYTGNAPVLIVTPESKIVAPLPETATFTVISNIFWTVSESTGWLTAVKTDDGTLAVSFDENTSVDPRSAEITIVAAGVPSKNLVITQAGASPNLSVTPESGSMSPANGTTTFTVTSNIDWSVSENSDWLTAVKTDATTLTVVYDENISVNPRSAEITVSGPGVTPQKRMVNQSGATPALSVTPESTLLSAETGIITFTVTSNINWSVSENSAWLTAVKTDAATVTVSYDENQGVDPRSTEITVSGPGVTSQNLVLNQNGAIPTLNVTPELSLISPAAGTTEFTVSSNIDWSISESYGWVEAIKINATTLYAIFHENTGSESRNAQILISGTGVETQSIILIQEGAIPSAVGRTSEERKIFVFPNPFASRTWITYPGGFAEAVEIYEPSGNLVMRLHDLDESGKTEIDLSGLNSGLYIYRLIDKEGNIYNGKILKQ